MLAFVPLFTTSHNHTAAQDQKAEGSRLIGEHRSLRSALDAFCEWLNDPSGN